MKDGFGVLRNGSHRSSTENVGNLLRPVFYDLGDRLVRSSLPATERKSEPPQYPTIFNSADGVIIDQLHLVATSDLDLSVPPASSRRGKGKQTLSSAGCVLPGLPSAISVLPKRGTIPEPAHTVSRRFGKDSSSGHEITKVTDASRVSTQ